MANHKKPTTMHFQLIIYLQKVHLLEAFRKCSHCVHLVPRCTAYHTDYTWFSLSLLFHEFTVSGACCKLLASASHIFECWAASSLVTTDTGVNQSAVPCDNGVIGSDWVRPIRLHHLEFHVRTLYLANVALLFEKYSEISNSKLYT